jgi:formiminoglutamase
MSMSDDPKWPRASGWLSNRSERPRFAVLGVPAHETSISATNAHTTPAAVREALNRYSTYSTRLDRDLAELPVLDLGDVLDPDHFEGELRVADAVRALPEDSLLFAIGGDNSITYSVMHGLGSLGSAGLVTLDAHHDLRDGTSNGSPVRRLIDAGLDPHRIVQIGINDFSNSAAYGRYARSIGVTVITRDEVAEVGMSAAMHRALGIAGGGTTSIYVDLDVDVCDRAVVPACPAAAPGGLSARDLRIAARLAGADPLVRAIDVTEVDATQDSPDGRTVRLAALCLLEAAMGRLSIL